MRDIPELEIALDSQQQALINKMMNTISSSECKAVCFRLEKTLVNIPFSERNDFFLLMESDFRKVYKGWKSFSDLRIYAEKKSPDDIEKIYDNIMVQAKIPEQECREFMEKECRLIQDFSFPRNFGKKLFNEAKNRKKKIIIISDSFYPRNVVVNMLEKCGYSGYKCLILEREHADKNIHDVVADKAKVSPKGIVSIGGDVVNDVETPIMKGMKALLLADTLPLMLKSGRLREYIQARFVYNYDSADFLPLHAAFGLYSAYMFDIPKTKVFQSDFCGSLYMIGFIVFGTLQYDKDFKPDDFQKKLISAAENNPVVKRGAEDFKALFSAHFDNILCNSDYKGFSAPFEFLADHCNALDRNNFAPELAEEWEKRIREPKLLSVEIETTNQNKLSEAAEKMFPKGTKVRSITDNILSRMKGKMKL